MRPPAYRLKGQTLHIADMLKAQPRHISFHTPGHKRAGADITELSYSDCLAHPEGVLSGRRGQPASPFPRFPIRACGMLAA